MKLRIILSIVSLIFASSVSAVEPCFMYNPRARSQSIITISQSSIPVQRTSFVNATWREFKGNIQEGLFIICDGEIQISSCELINLDMNRSRLKFPNLFNLTVTGWGNIDERTNKELENRLSILFAEGDFQNLSSFSYFGNRLNLPAEIENLEYLTYLELLGADRLVLPREIGKLVHLNRLILSNSKILFIPAEIGNLKNLRVLDIRESNLKEFPNEICLLSNLSILDISGNEFTALPEQIENLKYLKILNISYNELVDLPEEIWSLANLNTLDLSHNQLTNISPKIENLKSLEDLDIKDNKLTGLPMELGFLECLKCLAFSNNDFDKIPSNIFELPLLKELVINKEFMRYVRKDRIYSINMQNNEYIIKLDISEPQTR